MTEQLQKWIDENKLVVSASIENDADIISIEGVGRFLFVQPFEGKILDEDFCFMLSDNEYELLDEKKVDYILFEFGTKFYYSGVKQTKNTYNELAYKPEFNDFKYLGATAEPDVMPFVHLGVHDEYEIMNGSTNCDAWAKKAKFMGHTALGLANLNTQASSLAFQTACQKHGIKSIIGETVTVAHNYTPGQEIPETFELKLYVLTRRGYENLLQINRAINAIYFGFIPDKELKKWGEGLCCVIPKESEFNDVIGDRAKAMKVFAQLKAIFGKQLYYQIDTVEYVRDEAYRTHLSRIDEYIKNWRHLIPPVLINDAYYLDPEAYEVKEMLNAVVGRASIASSNQYFKSVGETFLEFNDWYDDVPELFDTVVQGIENTVVIAEASDYIINTGERKLPRYEVEDVEGDLYAALEKGFEERLVGKVPDDQLPVYLERLEKECSVIIPNGLSDYFMILYDIIAWCRDNDINVGPGRGSVCGSLMAYLLYIHDTDPLKYGLLFERFLNETRVSGERAKSADSLPDIDVDFPTAHRDEVKRYIERKYGINYVCAIGTYGRMKLKTCLKDFGRVKGLPYDQMNALTKDIDDQIEYTWGDLLSYASKSKALYKFVQENPDIVHMTKFAMLAPRSASIHPSAVVIVPKEDLEGNPIDIFSWMPVKSIDGVLVSEWEGKYIDKSGFLKEDILGLNQLDKFKGILTLIERNRGEVIDVNEIPLDDPEIYKIFQKGWCEDIFQFGTTGQMNFMRQVKPEEFEQLVAMTAVFRPGPMDSGAHTDFANIKNGKAKAHYDYGLKELTEPTFGLYVYQEQIMAAVNVLGGLSLVQADQLRTYMKKKDKKAMAALGEQFISGAVERGCSVKEAEAIWVKLDKFSGYGFNKSHAAAYTLMSYWGQWLKIYYPLEFWTTSLQWSKESEVPFRLAEMKKLKSDIEIRPPDINHSEGDFTCDPKNNRIFFSLTKIKGVGDSAVTHLLAEREKGGEFFSLEEFLSRVPSKVNKTHVERLIIAGAFDLIEGIERPRERKKLMETYLKTKKAELPEKYVTPESNTDGFWIMEQRAITGFGDVDYESMVENYVPSKRFAKLFVTPEEFQVMREDKEVVIAGKVVSAQEYDSKRGKWMKMSVDCNNTIILCHIWNEAYEKMEDEAEAIRGRIIAVSGRVKLDKWRGGNSKTLYSDPRTRIHIIQ